MQIDDAFYYCWLPIHDDYVVIVSSVAIFFLFCEADFDSSLELCVSLYPLSLIADEFRRHLIEFLFDSRVEAEMPELFGSLQRKTAR